MCECCSDSGICDEEAAAGVYVAGSVGSDNVDDAGEVGCVDFADNGVAFGQGDEAGHDGSHPHASNEMLTEGSSPK